MAKAIKDKIANVLKKFWTAYSKYIDHDKNGKYYDHWVYFLKIIMHMNLFVSTMKFRF